MKFLHRIYVIFGYYLSWVVFFAVGVALNIACMPLLLFPQSEQRSAEVRVAIRKLFVAWCAWLHAMRLIYVEWEGFTPEALEGPAVYIANHPGLLDATFIL